MIKAKQAQSRVKQFEKMGDIQKLSEDQLLGFNFPCKDCPAKVIMSVKNINFSYDKDEFKAHLINNFQLTIRKSYRSVIICKNGKGKSTLLNFFGLKIL